MGNRAVLTTQDKEFGIYLHWNGGLESVLAFCDVCRERGYRDPVSDPSYGMARLTAVCCEFMGSDNGLSVGIGPLSRLDCDNYDNGVYVIGKDWQVIARYGNGSEQVFVLYDEADCEKRTEITASLLQKAAA